MRVLDRSLEAVLVAANVAAVGLLVVVVLSRPFAVGTRSATGSPDPPTASRPPAVPALVVVGSANPADHVVGRALAASSGGSMTVLPTDGGAAGAGPDTAGPRPRRIVVVGGAGAVSQASRTALASLTTGEVVRRSGADRYATAARVATTEFLHPVPGVLILDGIDAAAGETSSLEVVSNGSPVLFVDGDRIPPSSAAALRRLRPGRIDVLARPGGASEVLLERLRDFTTGSVSATERPVVVPEEVVRVDAG